MLEESPKELRGLFLLKFTEELIRNHKDSSIYLLEEILNQKLNPTAQRIVRSSLTKEDIIERITKKTSRKPNEEILKDLRRPFNKTLIKNSLQPTTETKKVLRIPEPRLPERLQYLKPSITQEKIELGKLNILLNDPKVSTIESQGADQKIIVTGEMGKKPTNIVLTKDEIQSTLNEFSLKSKIPLTEGITKIALGNLILTAINSQELANPQFTITKIKEQPLIPPQNPFSY